MEAEVTGIVNSGKQLPSWEWEEQRGVGVVQFSGSVQLSCSVMSDSLQPHGLEHAMLPCLSLTPRAYSTHVHRVSDAIQPSHPLSSPTPLAFNLSQQQGLFK